MKINTTLPVITLYQPWATWIMRGWKTIESRTHNRFACLKNKTILIHAGQHTDDSDAAIKNQYLTHEQIIYNPNKMINGYILGTAHVYDYRRLNESHSHQALIECATPRYGLFLNMVNQFHTPIPCKGEMGIWYFDLDKGEKTKKNKEQIELFQK